MVLTEALKLFNANVPFSPIFTSVVTESSPKALFLPTFNVPSVISTLEFTFFMLIGANKVVPEPLCTKLT